MKMPQHQKGETQLQKILHFEQEIFSPRESHNEQGDPIETKLNYEALNDFFNYIVIMKTRSLWTGLTIMFFINALVTGIIYLFSSSEFILGFYYLPLGLFFLAAWGYLRKSEFQINKQLYLNMICLVVLGISFFCSYFIILHPIIHQEFHQASQCQIESSRSTKLGNGKQEEFTILTLSFYDANGDQQIGCGCISTKSDSTVISDTPFPYSYIYRNDDMDESLKTNEYTFSKLKIPSWFCASNLDSITDLEVQLIGQSQNKIKVNECYYNNYLGYDQTFKNTNPNLCYEQSEFLQVIFKEKPYYDKAFFHVIIALLFEPFFSFSFIWPVIMLTYVIFRYIRKRKYHKHTPKPKKEKIKKSDKISLQIQPEPEPSISEIKSDKSKQSSNQNVSLLNAVSTPNLDNSILNNSAISHLHHKRMLKHNLAVVSKKVKLEPIDMEKHKKYSKHNKK